jgi:CubicO group peptidase (beta-lactamase class C family)
LRAGLLRQPQAKWTQLAAAGVLSLISITSFANDRQPAELRQRLDTLIPAKMQALNIPGVAISVVKDGRVWLTKGYGVADLETGRPVDAERTGFRIASLSKLFTATAVMQLAEAGKVDLHADIRRYLDDLSLPLQYEEPVTLHHLLTHTAGFDLSDIGDAAPTPEELHTLRAWIETHPQPQVFSPGFAYHYSNFGFALAGYIVERVSGLPFPKYVDRHIFQPLGLAYSTFEQPPPAWSMSEISRGYHLKKGQCQPLPFDYSQMAPANALISTAEDMSRFLLAQLGNGSPLLSPESRREMHRQQFAASPSPFGMAYGFHENRIYGRRALDHSGGQLGFSSYLVLIPELELGIFLSQNRREGQLHRDIIQVIAESVAPGWTTPDLQLKPAKEIDTRPYAGLYRHTGYTRHTFEKMAYALGFLGVRIRVEAAGPGTIAVHDQPYVWKNTHEFVHAANGLVTRRFLIDQSGKVTHQVSGKDVYEKTPWWERAETLRSILVLSIALSLWYATLWPWLVRRRIRKGDFPVSRERLIWRRLIYSASGLWFITYVYLFGVVSLISERPVQFDYGVAWEVKIALSLLLIAMMAALAIPPAAILAWRRGWWSVATRIGLTLYAAVLFGAIAVLGYLNLIGFQY